MNGVDTNGTRTLRYRYTYDEANQITRVDDNIQSKTYVYQYDKGGNRVSEKIYAYTLSDTLGTVQQEIVSEYDNIVWDDLLTSYNGKEITYDNAGNPTSYDGKTFVWNGKQLKQITAADGSKTLFDYDANGLRTRKVQYDETNRLSYYVEYIWAEGKIISQYLTLIAYVTYSDGSTKSVPIGPIPSKIIYDDNGIPQGFTCGEANFGFVRNLQGDVIAMVDFEGNIVMEYSYDPWGNIEYHLNEEVTTEEEAIIYTALCPLTYRGYNYDFTTGLYYLQSRYYNPEWGRFLNCDDTAILLATQGETHNANLFAYCANNPVNRVDYTGYDWDANKTVVAYIITPLLILGTKLGELGLSYILEYATVCNIKETDSGLYKLSFSSYGESIYSKYFFYQEQFEFSFFFGDFLSWSTELADVLDKITTSRLALWAVTDLATKIGITFWGVPGFLFGSLLDFTLSPITDYFKEKHIFGLKSAMYLLKFQNDYPETYEDGVFYALGHVLKLTLNTTPTSDNSTATYLYEGDEHIYGAIF